MSIISGNSETRMPSGDPWRGSVSSFTFQMANDSTETSEAGEEEEEHEGDNDNKERMPFIQ